MIAASNQLQTEQMLEPNADAMIGLLEHLFGGDLDGCHDGLVELAWNGPDDADITKATLYGTDQLDELVDQAMGLNAVPGQNVYFGAALRMPDASRSARTTDKDFFALTAYYADADLEGHMERARTVYRMRECPPTAAVVTGRHPHCRAQLFWRQEAPERDPEQARRQNKALVDAFGCDGSVVNPGRLLRLAGSIAWPKKPGRVAELTEFRIFDDGRPRLYLPGQVARAFPLDPPKTADAPSPNKILHIGSEFDGVSVEDCLALILNGEHWHNNAVRLVAHWIGRGWSDTEILTAAEALTLPGYTVEQTRQEVARMIKGGRVKWNIANPRHEVEDPAKMAPVAPAFLDELDPAKLPVRRWLLERTALRGYVTVEVAPPGVGKSTLNLQQSVALVTGREITGQRVYEQTKVWIYNNEDDGDELRRRVAAILQHWKIPFSEIRGRLALNSGADRPLLVAKTDGNNVIRLPDVDGCIEHIRAHGIGVFIVDPFVETHEVNENANEQIKAVAAMFRDIARKGDCAVILVHHTAKPPQGNADGHAGNLNTARGASALVGVARIVQTLFSMSRKDAETYGVPDDDRHRYIRLDDAKANMNLISGSARWFRREGVTIANGDEVGVLVPEDLEPIENAGVDAVDDLHHTVVAALLAQVSEDEISLNAAAVRLAWGPHERFHQYRQTDKDGHQRASRTLRGAVIAACDRGITIVNGGCSRGFTHDQSSNPVMLRRFDVPMTSGDLAAQAPDFPNEDVNHG